MILAGVEFTMKKEKERWSDVSELERECESTIETASKRECE